jgi:hypothetical protein
MYISNKLLIIALIVLSVTGEGPSRLLVRHTGRIMGGTSLLFGNFIVLSYSSTSLIWLKHIWQRIQHNNFLRCTRYDTELERGSLVMRLHHHHPHLHIRIRHPRRYASSSSSSSSSYSSSSSSSSSSSFASSSSSSACSSAKEADFSAFTALAWSGGVDLGTATVSVCAVSEGSMSSG